VFAGACISPGDPRRQRALFRAAGVDRRRACRIAASSLSRRGTPESAAHERGPNGGPRCAPRCSRALTTPADDAAYRIPADLGALSPVSTMMRWCTPKIEGELVCRPNTLRSRPRLRNVTTTQRDVANRRREKKNKKKSARRAIAESVKCRAQSSRSAPPPRARETRPACRGRPSSHRANVPGLGSDEARPCAVRRGRRSARIDRRENTNRRGTRPH